MLVLRIGIIMLLTRYYTIIVSVNDEPSMVKLQCAVNIATWKAHLMYRSRNYDTGSLGQDPWFSSVLNLWKNLITLTFHERYEMYLN